MALDLQPVDEQATGGGLDLQPLEELNEQHPDITFKDRALIKNVGMQIGPDAVTRYLTTRGFEVDTPDGVTFRVKKPGELEWRRIDPEGFDVQDLTDIGGDVFKGAASVAGGIGGALLGSPSGVGAAVGGAGGAAAGGALAESALQGLGGLAGFGQTGGEAAGAVGTEGALGLALAPVGGAVGKLAGGVAKGVGGLARRALGRGAAEAAEEAGPSAARVASQWEEAVRRGEDLSTSGREALRAGDLAVKDAAESIGDAPTTAAVAREVATPRETVQRTTLDALETVAGEPPLSAVERQRALREALDPRTTNARLRRLGRPGAAEGTGAAAGQLTGRESGQAAILEGLEAVEREVPLGHFERQRALREALAPEVTGPRVEQLQRGSRKLRYGEERAAARAPRVPTPEARGREATEFARRALEDAAPLEGGAARAQAARRGMGAASLAGDLPAPPTAAVARQRGLLGKAAYALGHPIRAAKEALDAKVKDATARSATPEAYGRRVAAEFDKLPLEQEFEVDFRKRSADELRHLRGQKAYPFDPEGPPTQKGFVKGAMEHREFTRGGQPLRRKVSVERQYDPEDYALRHAVDLDLPMTDPSWRNINIPGVERLAVGGTDIPIPREIAATRASVIADMIGKAASAPYQALGRAGGKFGLGPKATAVIGGSLLPGVGGAGAAAVAGAHFALGKPAAWLARRMAEDPAFWVNRLLGSAGVPPQIKRMVEPIARAVQEQGPGRAQALVYTLMHNPTFRAWADEEAQALAGAEGEEL